MMKMLAEFLFCRWSTKFCNLDFRRPRTMSEITNRTCSRYVKIDANDPDLAEIMPDDKIPVLWRKRHK
jgi:hypothetical protein